MKPRANLSLMEAEFLVCRMEANRDSVVMARRLGPGTPLARSDTPTDFVTVVTLEEIGGLSFMEAVDLAFDRLESGCG